MQSVFFEELRKAYLAFVLLFYVSNARFFTFALTAKLLVDFLTKIANCQIFPHEVVPNSYHNQLISKQTAANINNCTL